MQKNRLNYILIILVVAALIYFLQKNSSEQANTEVTNPAEISGPVVSPKPSRPAISPPTVKKSPEEITTAPALNPLPSPIANQAKEIQAKPTEALHFEVTEDGLVTVDADIVLGVLKDSDATTGMIAPPTIHLWPQGVVPYFIQGHFENPERVKRALEMFEDAPVRLVPERGETDILVFEPAPSGCKSYVGKVGGKQPIWLGPECGPREIAHEIMHALGFIHEQNRTDRDQFVKIYWNNINPKAKINFEKFPPSMMTVSGLMPFDYRSIMIYSPSMFAVNSTEETMQPTDKRMVIEPSEGLTTYDVLRLDKAYRK